ncbi:DUF1403 family protein [Limimaricola cinnabarinus]|uniref:HTH DNA binding domain-containing protein n=1 Tax=Limimaricola cinnabarinus LL-001 TaxID=1337093 RepID=U3AM74_9RHOB|nr:DUF1403 family protein [Limimaricola cinnabarinus]GAD55828.1 hypothetical protein MBELCI_1880 [Limimaricola cinnabarinus LL-001]
MSVLPHSSLPASAWPAAPRWSVTGRATDLEEAAFRAGAALAHLHGVRTQPGLPLALWRARLALEAAAASVRFSGRSEGLAELRDALCLARPGDPLGPAGEIGQAWHYAVTRPLTTRGLAPVLPGVAPDLVQRCLAMPGAPVARAAQVLEAVLAEAPRAETEVLILADAALARALGWDRIVPLLAIGLAPRDLRRKGEDLRRACHHAVAQAAARAAGLVQDLAPRAARLHAVAPKLRAKGAEAALALFLAQDALAPVALTPLMSDRAARRLCDRLVTLGALRELTGRDSFRLYGL